MPLCTLGNQQYWARIVSGAAAPPPPPGGSGFGGYPAFQTSVTVLTSFLLVLVM